MEVISKKNNELVYLYNFNLVDEIWKESRLKPPKKPLRVHDNRYAGLDVPSKLSTLRSELIEAGTSAIVISMLDEVAWLLNLRGNDVPHSPVMYAYLIVEIDGAKLFVDNSKINPEVMAQLHNAGVELRPYESILSGIERDAAALAQFWAWLEEEIHKNVLITEVEVVDKLLQFRANQAGYMDTSFDTISASGANGAYYTLQTRAREL